MFSEKEIARTRVRKNVYVPEIQINPFETSNPSAHYKSVLTDVTTIRSYLQPLSIWSYAVTGLTITHLCYVNDAAENEVYCTPFTSKHTA